MSTCAISYPDCPTIHSQKIHQYNYEKMEIKWQTGAMYDMKQI